MEWMNGNENRNMYRFPDRMWIVTDEKEPKVIARMARKQDVVLAKGFKVITRPPEQRELFVNINDCALPPDDAIENIKVEKMRKALADIPFIARDVLATHVSDLQGDREED